MVKKESKRWLIVTQYYPPEVGAAAMRIRHLAKELRQNGFDVHVLTAMPNYPKGEIFPGYPKWKFRVTEKIDDIPVQRVWIYPGAGKSPIVRLLNYFSFTFTALLAVLFGPRPDVLFIETHGPSLGILGLLMKWVRGVPYIYNVPDLHVAVARQLGFIKNEVFLKAARDLENFFLKQSWKVSTVSQGFIQHFKDRGVPRKQITFLPNGADTEFLYLKPPCPEMLDRWNLRGKKVFLYVGTHGIYHGLETLIHAAKLLEDDQKIMFLMVGQGSERERLKKLAEDLQLPNMKFADSSYEERDRLYSISYASIVTLRDLEVAKTMRPAKIFPSLSCRIPVIFSGAGEAADLIRINQCGICVNPEDTNLLASAIRRLASDPGARDHMGKMGRKLVEAEYSWHIIVKRWLHELGMDSPKK